MCSLPCKQGREPSFTLLRLDVIRCMQGRQPSFSQLKLDANQAGGKKIF